MAQALATRLLCHHCAVTLSGDDGHHYGYECHDCVVREHELILLWRRDPDHPEAERLFAGPVDIGERPTLRPASAGGRPSSKAA